MPLHSTCTNNTANKKILPCACFPLEHQNISESFTTYRKDFKNIILKNKSFEKLEDIQG